ncbi:tetratricopeptide repeat protein [Yoonia maritima]|uniref:tetratricopeptide repeat protein n=1 Tax=Yoonia maritima TaxID=1435347 RepID=UPI000D0F2077|nr:SEL1-like repeat protein [Yoonia maritima]
MFGFVSSPKQNWSAILSVLALSVAPIATSAQEASTNVLDLEFLPPEITPSHICVPRAPDADTIETWRNWDGVRLPNVDHALIKRDINRLQQINASYWLETIELIITRLAEADPSYAGNNALLARISAMVAAGAFEELSSQQLIAQLAADEELLSPRIKTALSGYFRNGLGVERDVEHADALLVDAGYSGNADALLTLTKRELAGTSPEGWDVAPELAVTMAFGSLVGELNPSICDRVARIAREYSNGEIVRPNPQLAHDWFRFAADLGDSNSAWKIVEFHMLAENFEKDNDVLLHYLTQAADAQLPYAQIALGRVYETGALVERDLDRTLQLFRAAAKSGGRPGLTRLALFLETYADRYPGTNDERLAALNNLAEHPGAAGWVFSRLADDVYERKGRWGGQAEALVYLERAAELGDMDGSINLAINLVAQRSGEHEIERAVDLLSYSVSALGGVNPAKLLHGVFMCQAPDSPRVQEAQYWQSIEAATGTSNVEIAARDLIELDNEDDALTIALIQSHALYGRAKAMASYLKYLENSPDTTPEMLAFWHEYSNQYTSVLEALADLEFELAENPAERIVAFSLLRQEYKLSGAPAALALAQAILDYQSDTEFSTADVRTLLEAPAGEGQGAAMQLLAALDPSDDSGRAVFEQFADVIEANGDFDALLFAVPFLEAEKQENYLSRAAGIIPCDYKNVMAMSRLYLEIGNSENAVHWMRIAEYLMEDNPWTMVDLARSELNVLGVEAAPKAMDLFERAAALGDVNAPRGMFDLLVTNDAETYDPERAALLITQAMDDPEHAYLNRFLGAYRGANDEVKAEIESRLDMPQVYMVAAESGDIFSMRTYALYLRENAANTTDLATSTEWLARAAEGGDTTAMAELGYALAFGIGTEADLDNAVVWLERAAANGSDKAATITALLNLNEDT